MIVHLTKKEEELGLLATAIENGIINSKMGKMAPNIKILKKGHFGEAPFLTTSHLLVVRSSKLCY